MPLLKPADTADLAGATVIVAMDAWVDAGAASTAAAGLLADGPIVATFKADLLYDYRARRPALEIVDGRPDSLSGRSWPSAAVG